MSRRTAGTCSAALALLAAGLAGAAGLGLQVNLASAASLPLGAGTGPALALAAFVASWALGAWLAGRAGERAPALLLSAGLALAGLAPLALLAVVRGTLGAPGVLLAVGVVGLLQGLFLPALARGRASRAVALLFALNLAGAWLGAFGIADVVVRDSGRVSAALVAGGAALAAGLSGWAAQSRRLWTGPATASALPSAPAERQDGPLGPCAGALVVGLGTAWMGGVEWTLVRLGALWFGGMQDALTAVLSASLAALALGAALLPPLLPRGARGVAWGLAACALASCWILVVDRVLPGVADAPLALRALVLCVPALAPFGALLPLVHRARGGESGRALGDLVLHEVWGACLGIPLVQLVLTPAVGLAPALAAVAALGAVAALAVVRAARAHTPALAAAVAALAAAALLARAEPPALRAPALANPAFVLRSFAEDRDFAVTVVDDGLLGERTLLTDGFRAAGTGRDYRYMRVLGHLPLLLHPHPGRVAVLALGTGTTVGAVSLHPEVERIDVLEISRAVVEAAPLFAAHNRDALAEGLPGLLDDSDAARRVVVRLGDGRRSLRESPGAYDVVTMEPLLPDSPFGVHLYTEEAYAVARRALKPGGLVCQWVPPHALEPATYAALHRAFWRAFPWSATFVSGTQEILIGAEREPAFDPARFPAPDDAGELARELRELGLDTPGAAGARLARRERWDASHYTLGDRRLTDLDPWIAYRPRRAGPELLLDLARNLPVGDESDPLLIAPWQALEPKRAEALRALRRARRAHAAAEARLRGVLLTPDSAAGSADEHLARALDLAPDDPEPRAFAAELQFLADLRAGVAALAAGSARDAALAALDPLTSAALARPERADVHAYVAAALARIASPAAEKAWDAALARCPRLAQTEPGRRALELGPPLGAWKPAERGD
ncbi:MAG: hypothetical protein JNK02_13475 [Planctomycetes bacterium]|nr:hypothetical protein [Planctomycetota bacterium]